MKKLRRKLLKAGVGALVLGGLLPSFVSAQPLSNLAADAAKKVYVEPGKLRRLLRVFIWRI